MIETPTDLIQRPAVRRLLDVLSQDGDEARVVGGAVRDAVMGRPVSDIDVATTCLPDDVMRRIGREGWRAIPTGLEHGTVTVLIQHQAYEVTTLRRDVETDGRRAVVAFTRDFAEDAHRRDFTINALSLSADGQVHDYASGTADAVAGVVRFMGDPETRIREDYLRILRFFRFRASHGHGEPDAPAFRACEKLKDGLDRLSRERVRIEMLKLLAAPQVIRSVDEMSAAGLWAHLASAFQIHPTDLRRLVRLEEALGRQPDALIRLGALLGVAERPDLAAPVQARFALSNAQHDRLAQAARGVVRFRAVDINTNSGLRRAIYLTGPAHAADAALLNAASLGVEPQTVLALFQRMAPVLVQPPRNPFTSAMVAAEGIAAGPSMGAALKRAEGLWLAAGLPDAPKTVEKLLKDAIRTPAD